MRTTSHDYFLASLCGFREIEGDPRQLRGAHIKMLRRYESQILKRCFGELDTGEFSDDQLSSFRCAKKATGEREFSFWFRVMFLCDDDKAAHFCILNALFYELHFYPAPVAEIAEAIGIVSDEAETMRSSFARLWLGRFKNGAISSKARVS